VPAEAEQLMRDAGLEPLEPYPGSEAPWLCTCMRCGREVLPRYGSVKRGQGGCRACSAARAGAGKRISADAAAAIMRGAGLEPLVPYPGSNTPWRCQCVTCGQEVTPNYTSIKRGGGGCRFCARKAVAADEAVAIMRAAGLEPLGPYPGARPPWPSTCLSCGAEVAPRFDYVQRYGSGGCLPCSHRKRDYAARKPIDPTAAVEVMMASRLKPLVPFPGGNARWECECLVCGRVITPRYDRVRRDKPDGCSYCARRKTDPEAAAAAMRAAGLEPLGPYPGSQTPWPCRCTECGREVSPSFSSIDQDRGGCIYCSHRAVTDTDAASVMRGAGLEPLEPYPGSKTPWRCRCTTCGREVAPRYNPIQQGRGGCPYCAGTATDAQTAVAVMRAAALEPLEPYPGSQTSWRCRCQMCGREVTPNYHNVRAGNGGCLHCTDSGFWMRHDSLATVYLLVNEPLRALKVGIMRQHSQRLEEHLRNGWRLIDAWRDLDPPVAFGAEQAVLAAWRTAGIPDAVTREEMPQGGHSETAPIDLVDLAQTRAIIEECIG
jgi:recombinational DNA repair protein (RecF pathway)